MRKQVKTRAARPRQGMARVGHWPLWLAVAAGPAMAEDAPSLPAVTVSGEGVAQEAPTVAKLPLTVREIPQSVTVIGQEQMREQNLQSLDDVMQHATGITVQPYQMLTTAYYARGFKVDSFEQDGVPVLMGNMAASPQDMAVYERVEILRGANGLMHGAGNPAATVNLVRKRPQREFSFNGSVSAGSWDRYRAEADLGGPLNDSGSVRGRIVSAVEDRGYFYDVADQQSALLYAIGEVDLGPQTVLSAGVQTQRIRSTTNMAGVPRYKDGGDIGLSRSTYLDAAWDRFNWDTTRVFADLEHRFGDGWTTKVSANYLTADSNLKYAGAYGAIDRQTGLGSRLMGGAYKFDNTQASVDAYVSGPIQLFGRRHELLLGGNAQRTTSEQYTGQFTPALNVPVNVFDWDPHGVPEPGVGPYASPGETRLKQQGVYGMGRFSLADPVTLVLGGRMSWWNQTAPGARQQIDPEFTPYGGLIVDLNSQWSLYGSYAQVFQPQSQLTREGKPLDPVTGTNYEAGVKGELADGALNVSLAVFQIQQKDRAMQDPDWPCVGNNCYYVQGGEVRSRGIEAEANGQITPNWSVAGGYTFNTSKYVKDPISNGQPFASFTPKHIFRVWTNYALPVLDRRLSVGGGVQMQSGYSTVSGPVTLRQGGVTLVDLRAAYRVDKHVTVALNLNNVFDRGYYQSLSGTSWNNRYGEPRNAMLTLRAQY
ncbi:outer membrane receptor for ferric coprogen and ferric-rhodotorulic acid [Achromobacter marplatensis]|uniref:Outer membrane receptor for ferric coprogen and ferric-rhodotorulic acid n=2 Tax=Achromobacter marplatensis TaxID=470868 RepID=A0ABX9G7X5_9BURK|nr:outer membrane receptor for ferric coprogen and ferric-rhodotorulic acid [Achromobacter marplatensis]CAB3666604.1 Fe(3+)-pyochelin receptor [Achromobacter marplatensis]